MKSHRRWLILLAALICLLAAGLAFRSFMMANLIMPVVMIVWLVLRVFMTVDQEVYWLVFIFAAFVLGLGLLPGRSNMIVTPVDSNHRQPAKRFSYWKKLIGKAGRSREDQIALENKLRELMVDVIATEEQMHPDEVRRELLQRNLPLPTEVYRFLSPGADGKRREKTGGISGWRVERINQARKSNAAGKMDMRRLLEYLETYAEIKDEHGRDEQN